MRKRIISFFLTLVLLLFTACNTVTDELTIQYDADNMPAWVQQMFTEEEIASGALLTILTSADYQTYATLEELIAREISYIIKAQVMDERVEWLDYSMPIPDDVQEYLGIEDVHVPRYEPHTVHRIQVLDVFKGDIELGAIVEIAQLGGQIGNLNVLNRDELLFQSGETLLFFLSDPNLDVGREMYSALPFIFVNPWQTVYRVPSDMAIESDGEIGEDEIFEHFHPQSASIALTLTMGDLQRIQQENFGLTGH